MKKYLKIIITTLFLTITINNAASAAVVMREAGVTQALTFDRHFAQAGFECLLREIT